MVCVCSDGLACDVSNALLTLHGERLSHHDMLLTSGTDHNCSPVKQETVMSKSHLLQRKTGIFCLYPLSVRTLMFVSVKRTFCAVCVLLEIAWMYILLAFMILICMMVVYFSVSQ